MGEHIIVNEVGLRDGLQNQPREVPLDAKLELLDALLAAGIDHVEATSFVHPKLVPQMADADAMWPRLPEADRVAYTALVPNEKGLSRAVAAGARAVALVIAATETMNRRNINMGLDEAIAVSSAVLRRAAAEGVAAKAYISVASVCPFEGRVGADVVVDLSARLFDAGAGEVVIADTIGAASPAHVAELLDLLVPRHGADRLAVHFHDTQALALANCWVAVERGIRRFDSSIGGLGGCPFAPGAAGNVATEDLVHLFHGAGFETGIDMAGLVTAVAIAGRLTGRRLGGRVLDWVRSQRAR